MYLDDLIIGILAAVTLIGLMVWKRHDIEQWQKSVQGKPLSWTDRGGRYINKW